MISLPRIPGIGLVIAFVIVLASAGAWSLYRHGERAGEVQVHRVALQDSVHVAVAAVHTARRASDRAVAVASRAKARSDATRAKRALARLAVATTLDSAPPAVVELVHTDDALLAADSATIAAQSVAIDSLRAERAPSDALDSLRVHEVALRPPDDEGHRFPVAVVLGTAAVVLAIVHWAH